MTELVSILIPCRNEESFIETTLDNLFAQDYPREQMEVFVIDGRSTDKTREVVEKYAKKEPAVQLLDNPEGIVPFALNKAIKASKGSVILRMDAHSEYPPNYVSRLVSVLIEKDVDNVGGVWETLPASDAIIPSSIAAATSHPFGIGNASYRLGAKDIKEVDTVPYGCYKRDVFDQIGLFDTELVRNQDDEFNARLLENGGKILLVPDVVIRYFARPTWNKMMKMFYQYGFYKPLVNKKLKKPATIRQFVPFAMVGGTLMAFVLIIACILLIALTPITDLSYGLLAVAYGLILALAAGWTMYGVLALVVSLQIAIQKNKMVMALSLPLTFLMIHLSYGWGYTVGIFYHILLGKKGNHREAEISR